MTVNDGEGERPCGSAQRWRETGGEKGKCGRRGYVPKLMNIPVLYVQESGI